MNFQSAARVAVLCTYGAVTFFAKAALFTDKDWVSLGASPGTVGQVNALASDTNRGLLYVAGQFHYAGNRVANNIALWDGTNGGALGEGVNGTVYAVTVDAAGNVYAGGQFTQAGTVGATNIAKWNGTTWSA